MSGRAAVLVVCDGETPHVIPAVRSLGAAGFTVGVATPQGSARRGAGSRFTARTHDVPQLHDGLTDYLEAVERAIQLGGYDVVLPGDDADLLALSWGRDRLGALLPYAEHDVVVRAVDKLELAGLAARAGLTAPATVAADDDAVARATPPLVVKARLHWTPEVPADDRHVYAIECATHAEVVDGVAAMRAAGALPLLQERIDGGLLALSVLVGRSGRVLAASQQHSDRLSLRRTSVLAQTVPVDAALLDGVTRLLADLGWVGLANLQFLRGSDGVPRLIDFNGRFYGSLALAIRAGVDLPALWVSDALGEDTGAVRLGRPGVRFHAAEEDLRRARRERKGGLFRDVIRALAAFPGSAHTTWSVRDPGPVVRRLRTLAGTALGRSPGPGDPASGDEPPHPATEVGGDLGPGT